jgi:hypothetical protein
VGGGREAGGGESAAQLVLGLALGCVRSKPRGENERVRRSACEKCRRTVWLQAIARRSQGVGG